MSGALQRLVTGVVGAGIATAGIFLLPSWPFLAVVTVVGVIAAKEYGRLVRQISPAAPTWALYPVVAIGVPVYGWGIAELLTVSGSELSVWFVPALVVSLTLAMLLGVVVLLAHTPIEQAFTALGLLSFGAGYVVAPSASLHALREVDPWLLFLLAAIIWIGDSAAYYGGRAFGRRKLAPVVSPKKTWEGAACGLVGSLVAVAIWSQFRFGVVSPVVMAAGAATAVLGQIGDLVESIMKRSSGIKDSGSLLPGHGGILDRVDALFYGAVVLLLSVSLVGASRFTQAG